MSNLSVNSTNLNVPDENTWCIWWLDFCLLCEATRALAPATSPQPVRYATGGIQLSSSDLVGANGFGWPFGHSRSYNNLLSGPTNVGNGFNWLSSQWSMVSFSSDGATAGGAASVVRIIAPDGTTMPFTLDGSDYVAPFGSKIQMAYLGDTYLQTNPDGSTITYSALTGMFMGQSDSAGNTIDVVTWADNCFNPLTVERTTETTAGEVIERLTYIYDDPSLPSPFPQTVTLQRKTGSGDWVNVSAAAYTYYSDGDAHGVAGDLESATTFVWSGSDWLDTGCSYYRYYLSSGPSSSSSSSSSSSGGNDPTLHLLKFVLNAAAYNRMVADGFDPLTESDGTLSAYADYYFQYDNQRKVTLETVMSGSQTYEFSQETSGFTDDYNHWQTKTTETLPDGNQNIIYTNYAGMTMLSVFQSGEDQWINFWRYDENANPILHAHPSAVTGYDEEFADLLDYEDINVEHTERG